MSQLTAVRPDEAPPRPAHPRTVGALWRNAVAAGHRAPAYLVRRDGRWHEVSWRDAARRVDDYANGLLALGVSKGDAFGIFASTSVEWALLDFALALVGGVTAPVYATSSSRDAAHALGHADAVGVLVEGADQRAKVEEARAELPQLEHVLSFADLDELAARGRAFAAEQPT